MYHFLLPLMEGMAAAGHEVVGICADGPLVGKIRARGFRVEVVPLARSLNPIKHLTVLGPLARLFRREGFDLIHFHTPIGAMTGRVAAVLSGAPRIVYTAHGFYFHERTPPLKRAAFVSLEWVLGRFTDTLFTQAEEDAATARRLKLCGDVMAIGNGSDPDKFHPDQNNVIRDRVRTELGCEPEKVTMLMVGRLVAEKGYRELLLAMADIDAELWVVGDRLASDHAGGIDQDIEAVRADPKRNARVRFLGYRSDVDDLMRAADIFILPSHREGMPRSIIEAMLTGLPVVATNIRGSREEVIDGETGLLIPVNDQGAISHALNVLVNDGDVRARLGAAGFSRARALYDERKVVQCQIDHLGLNEN